MILSIVDETNQINRKQHVQLKADAGLRFTNKNRGTFFNEHQAYEYENLFSPSHSLASTMNRFCESFQLVGIIFIVY